jgi:Ribonuclease G/E
VSPDNKPKIDDDEVLRQAKETLEIHLTLEANGYVVTTETSYNILIGVAANRGTIESQNWLALLILRPFVAISTSK